MEKKSKKPIYKNWWFWLLTGLGVVILAVIIVLAIPKGDKNDNKTEVEQVYTELKEVDVNGMTISEACEKVREAGWTVSEVAGNNDYTEKSDCSDTERKVVTVYYNKEKYYHDGSEKSNYETVSFRFQNEKKSTESSSSSSSTTSSNSNTSSSTTSSSSSSWKSILSEYEAWVDKYVEFMKKYKNASASDLASMSSDYTKLTSQISDWTKKLQDAQGSLSGSDLTEYLNTLNRINAKMAAAN